MIEKNKEGMEICPNGKKVETQKTKTKTIDFDKSANEESQWRKQMFIHKGNQYLYMYNAWIKSILTHNWEHI